MRKLFLSLMICFCFSQSAFALSSDNAIIVITTDDMRKKTTVMETFSEKFPSYEYNLVVNSPKQSNSPIAALNFFEGVKEDNLQNKALLVVKKDRLMEYGKKTGAKYVTVVIPVLLEIGFSNQMHGPNSRWGLEATTLDIQTGKYIWSTTISNPKTYFHLGSMHRALELVKTELNPPIYKE